MRYRNAITGAVIETYGEISGEGWQAEPAAASAALAQEKAKAVAKPAAKKTAKPAGKTAGKKK